MSKTVSRPAAARRSAARTPAAMPPFDAMEHQQAELIVLIPLDKLHNHPGNPDPTESEIVAMMAWLSEQRQQEPITVRELAEPIGHYQVLAGKTRLAAARRLGWDTLEARVRSDLADEAAAIRFAATNNSLRRSETTLRQARWVAYLVEQGQGIEEAGRLFDWSRSHATNMVGLLKLPEPWLSRVASGEMPPTVACRLNPYAGIPELMKAFDQDYRLSDTVGRIWSHKDGIVGRIRCVLNECTRPMEGGKHNYGWALGGEHRRYFHDDDAAAANLRCVELPIGKNGALQRVALNTKEYDRLNVPLIKKRLEAQTRDRDSKNRTPGKPATTNAVADAKRKRQEQDEQVTAWITRIWRPAFLRLCVSEAVRALPSGEHWRIEAILPWLLYTCGRGMGVNIQEFDEYAAGVSMDHRRTDHSVQWLERVWGALHPDEDPVTEVEARQKALVALLLWPQDARSKTPDWSTISAELPFGRRMPPLDNAEIEALAERINVPVEGKKLANLREGWLQSARPSKQRDMVEVLFGRHTRGQLNDWARELCTGRSSPDGAMPAPAWVLESSSKMEQVTRLLKLHTPEHPLAMPKVLTGTGDTKRTKRKG